MNLREYQLAASRTSSGNGYMIDPIEWSNLKQLGCGGRASWRLANSMAVAAEAGELLGLALEHPNLTTEASKLVLKELGDVTWYLAEAASAIGFDLTTISECHGSIRDQGDRLLNLVQVAKFAGETADYIKKLLWHGKEIDWDTIEALFGSVLASIEIVGEDYGFTLEEIFEANIAKLLVRYSKGFSAAASEARVDLL